MADPHATQAGAPAHDDEHFEVHHLYGTLFFILLNFTAMEYFYAKFHTRGFLSAYLLGTAVILSIVTGVAAAIFKLKFNRYWVYLPLLPAIALSFLPVPLIPGLLILAIIKATLVGMYFMHLKFEGNWVYVMLVPAAFLAAVLVIALIPDIGMKSTHDEGLEDDEVALAPASVENTPTATARIRDITIPSDAISTARAGDP